MMIPITNYWMPRIVAPTYRAVAAVTLWDATQNGVVAGDSDTNADANTTAITNMLNNPNCPGVYFPGGTYRVNGIQVGNGKSIVGAGAWRTIIKAKSTLQTAVITAANAYGSSIRDLYIDGNKFGGANCDGILVQTSSSPPPYYNFLFQLTHCAIYFCKKNGLYLKGVTSTTGNNWVYSINDMLIAVCDEYGLRDESTDNAFSNFYISGCGKAGAYINAGNNKYVNMKIDVSGSVWTNDTTSYDGANIIIRGTRCSFNGIDFQQGTHLGAKILDSNHIVISGTIDSNGNGQNITKGLYINNSNNVSGNIVFSDFKGTQKTDMEIASNCTGIRIVSPGASNVINNSPATCKVITKNDTPVVVLTQAEYDTLPSSKTSNGILYAIKG